MSSIKIQKIDQLWPGDGLEFVHNCPYCGSSNRILAHKDVQDWAFYCAAGKWTYWECDGCNTLYLDPRPTKKSIGAAYNVYYTHHKSIKTKLISGIKQRLRNLCFYAWYDLELAPRFKLNRFFYPLLRILKNSGAEPFIPMCLSALPKGALLDVGCGSGELLDVARQLGWNAQGIELDHKAVITARLSGHRVTEGTYDLLEQYNNEFDCVVCSHVLEHIHEPLELLKLISKVLKKGGTLLLAVPNSKSFVRSIMKENWRGLEAPRHLVMPTIGALLTALHEYGLKLEQLGTPDVETLSESIRIYKSRGAAAGNIDISGLRRKQLKMNLDSNNMDIITMRISKS